MADLLKVMGEIEKNKNLEMNLPKYMNEMMSFYYRYASIQLAMDYYTYCEVKAEEEFPKVILDMTNQIDEIIKEALIGDFDGAIVENAVKETDKIRRAIIEEMKTITLYADQFQIYEYIVNRIEGKYDNGEVSLYEYSEQDFIQQIQNYILSDRDNSIIAQKIKMVVSNLPMRISRQRYYEILKESILLYEGSQKQALEDHVFLLESTAALIEPEKGKEYCKEYDTILELLRKTDFETLTQEEYGKVCEKLNFVQESLEEISSFLLLFVEVVNEVYILLLAKPYAIIDVKESENCFEIIRAAQEMKEEMSEEAFFELFEKLEGKQERLSERIFSAEYLLDTLETYTELMQSMMIEKIYHALRRIEKLNSTSNFIEFEREEDTELVDRAYAEKKANEVIDTFAKCFQVCGRREMRSRMASTVMILPVFFQNLNEFNEYVEVAFMGCKDEIEKKSSMMLLEMEMDSDLDAEDDFLE